jgi:hypothetical protein
MSDAMVSTSCSTPTVDEANWKALIDRCAESGEDIIINNGSAEHAAYLLEKFFSCAKEEVLIFSGELFDRTFGREAVLQKAIEFLKTAGRKICVIFESKDATIENIKNNPFIKAIINAQPLAGSFELYDGRYFSGKANHFAVMDKRAFRYELVHQNSIAIANFGDHEFANELSQLFEVIALGSERAVLGV